MSSVVEGRADPAFRGVRDVFEASLAAGDDIGGGVAVFVGGRPVVDLWGGIADPRTGRAWVKDTPCVVFSSTKGITATAALMVLERCGLDPGQPVTDWWPEYGAAGKESTTTADLFTHRAGLPLFDRPVSAAEAADPWRMAELLAAQAPVWQPGAQHGYHALTFGWLLAELVRRHTGMTVGDFIRREIGADLHIGAPAPMIAAAARLLWPPAAERRWAAAAPPLDATTVAGMAAAYRDPSSLVMRASTNPAGSYHDPEVLAGGWPATGAVTTPRALAACYRDLVGGSLITPQLLREATREHVRGTDTVLLLESAFGLGYTLPAQNMVVPNTARPFVFGHPGAGGSIGLGDVENQVAIGYIPNMRRDWLSGDRRAYRLIEAVYAAL
ncbi:serine hydrolase domain-containing protein [Nocardia huaxiensis]|uniref:Beta-lactamase family protein n=1 Tax=Nocardia huaxiensis TaxID=2755382 RepID=A0A7D6VHC3_9NOCA|nr:serine hydrolase domain-containing protein [Nocardia huaxiensis]QLY30076.1 beta-lactamase family protein [Nocardia huaxiensis]UFS96320.1 beta-lactamase family protein [Nocardia huaxiensis]